MRFLSLIFILSVFIVAGCTSQPSNTSSAVPAPGFEDVEEKILGVNTGSGTQGSGELREFTVTARRFSFNPDPIEVNIGDTVRITITSQDVAHGFALDEFGVNAFLRPGIASSVEFVADRAGTFRFYCTVPCGSGHSGMLGRLIVK